MQCAYVCQQPVCSQPRGRIQFELPCQPKSDKALHRVHGSRTARQPACAPLATLLKAPFVSRHFRGRLVACTSHPAISATHTDKKQSNVAADREDERQLQEGRPPHHQVSSCFLPGGSDVRQRFDAVFRPPGQSLGIVARLCFLRLSPSTSCSGTRDESLTDWKSYIS